MLNSPKSRRPKKTSIHDDRAIIRISKADPFKTAVDVAKEFNNNMAYLSIEISISTVKRRLQCAGFFWKTYHQKTYHTQEESEGPIAICT